MGDINNDESESLANYLARYVSDVIQEKKIISVEEYIKLYEVMATILGRLEHHINMSLIHDKSEELEELKILRDDIINLINKKRKGDTQP